MYLVFGLVAGLLLGEAVWLILWATLIRAVWYDR